ncbi:hypothetical protein A3B02_01315 [Candidatus Roizmanbacteria bacterium RIFCSPLOWO2_01_FULL_42_14]|uniref:50S ribosomal protein L22 n=4 Tax=Candidatus Roizmaniibacteriota TaxID=1752723 RepID=A0A1F7JUY5_9BACT|nr:MAG: hypothetical protein A3D08_02070 [Candidatus Roizmanbacteria bacterium RIFCSPHIGHO2_02_FULL_43_11]OGK38599.1 MAG: hypothetical protein A3F32_03085 [Candidatus Roizmanbacteria bacterium RIFCSPHIGHO2_12_FULL_42_10]OGK52192.1 MAG: hypothetical protein A3B02_01315 [Candidatus Roizmanbacteria bacterium RIFCSPLOWO2_01_FULL_42_14]OGK59425.1 MAG: hypothetical protein A3I56_02000 [Candidatus Roizmanbacteria bacterium RIFCSPLOWO2_02_FULL_43_10]
MSPLKLRALVSTVKVLPPKVALDRLSLSKTRSAKFLYKALKSAVDNGKIAQGFDVSKAHIKTLKVDEGPVLKRFRAGSKGMAKPYVRKSSHITVVIEQKEVVKEKKVKASRKKSEVKSVTKK